MAYDPKLCIGKKECGVCPKAPFPEGACYVAEGPQRSNYPAVIDAESCTACGACIKRCPVDAISEDPHHPKPHAVKIHRAGDEPERVRGASVVHRDKCIGSGVCVIGFPEDSILMEPVSEGDWFHVPSSMAEWEEMHLRNIAAEDEGDGKK